MAGTQLLPAKNPWLHDCDLQWACGKLGPPVALLWVADLGDLTYAGPQRPEVVPSSRAAQRPGSTWPPWPWSWQNASTGGASGELEGEWESLRGAAESSGGS